MLFSGLAAETQSLPRPAWILYVSYSSLLHQVHWLAVFRLLVDIVIFLKHVTALGLAGQQPQHGLPTILPKPHHRHRNPLP